VDQTAQPNSLAVDLRTVQAPYVRLAAERFASFSKSSVIQKWELRFTQPNLGHLSTEAIHSLEHLLAEHVRNHLKNVFDVSPMGCRTGFYLTLVDSVEFEQMREALTSTFTDILGAHKVPATDEAQCGWSEHHSLPAAQSAAANFLAARNHWAA
jgi:S-ribosylhomocysteine lyase